MKQSDKSWKHPGGKLIELGPYTLTDEELLAILIGSGYKGRPAEQIAKELLDNYYSIAGLMGKKLTDLAKIKGLKDVKVARIAAAFEIARRLLRHLKKNRLKKGYASAAMPTVVKEGVRHLNRQIPPLAHTPMYLWHKWWSRKTWNVVGEFIKTYCPEGGIVFDPFAGSGITAMEALMNGRKAIVCDINPIAAEITRLTIKPINEILGDCKRSDTNLEWCYGSEII